MDLLQLPAESLRPLTAVEKQEDAEQWQIEELDQP